MGKLETSRVGAHMEDGVCDFAVCDNGGAALLRGVPCRVDLRVHAATAALALITELDLAVQLGAVGVNDPASRAEPSSSSYRQSWHRPRAC